MDELNLIKRKLEARKKELESRVISIKGDITHKNTPLSHDWSEQAIERENEEVLVALGNSSQIELGQIKQALKRIETGNYQICNNCGEAIPLKRLELVPHAINCTKCAEILEVR